MKFETLELIQKKKRKEIVLNKSSNEDFFFDTTSSAGFNDNILDTIVFDINLVSWEGEKNDFDLYYAGADNDFEDGTFTKKCIGQIEGHYINVDRLSNSNLNIFELFDGCTDIDGRSLYEDIFDNDYICDSILDELSDDAPIAFFHISTIYLKKEYRNKGYGTAIMKNIDKMLYFGADFIISFVSLHCNPLDKDKHNNDESMKKLAKFYEKCGFRHIGKEICMIKIIDEFVDESVNED